MRDPQAIVAHMLAHRAAREAEILAALARGPATVAELVAAIYAAVDPALHPAAGRNVLAHLIDLESAGLVVADGPPATARYRLAVAAPREVKRQRWWVYAAAEMSREDIFRNIFDK